MAGSYPNVPGPRMAYDKDGSVLFKYNSTDDDFIEISELEKQALNSENDEVAFIINEDATSNLFFLGFMFPEARNLDGIFICGQTSEDPIDNFMNIKIEYSADSTNFINGTWQEATETVSFSTETKPNYRSSINIIDINNVKAIKILDDSDAGNSGTIKNVHLYGNIVADSQRLAFWHPTQDIPLPGSALDFGDVSLGETVIKEFRIKNLSTDKIANDILIEVDDSITYTDEIENQYELASSVDNFYDQSILLDYINPQEISEIIYLKKITPSDATFSLSTIRIVAEVFGTWSTEPIIDES